MKAAELLFSNFSDHAIFSGMGILVSVYALYIEVMKAKDKNYKAACDLGENMSCSRVLTSRYRVSDYWVPFSFQSSGGLIFPTYPKHLMAGN